MPFKCNLRRYIEGLATEDISENHHTDHFFEKLMLDMHPMQQKAAMKGHWFTRWGCTAVESSA